MTKEKARMSRTFATRQEIRAFLFKFKDDPQWNIEETAYYEEKEKAILLKLHLGEGISAFLRVAGGTNEVTLEYGFIGNVSGEKTVNRLWRFTVEFLSGDLKKAALTRERPRAEVLPGQGTKFPSNISGTGDTVWAPFDGAVSGGSIDRVVFDDMYTSVDPQTGGSFHGC